jgi:hippurate hydrolase
LRDAATLDADMTIHLNNSISAMTPQLTEWRRDFHRHPELQYDLPRTAGVVAERLRAFGFDEVIEGVGKTGVLGVLHGAGGAARTKDKRVLFRADMDALPILEAGDAEYASATPGRMHACGHDGHTVMLLGAARHLAETRPFDGTLIFCFQPAEEGGAGAQAMIDDGMLERFPVKGAYAVHNWPGMPVGAFGVVRGPAMASADGFIITVEGTGGHAAIPYKTRDPIVAASHIVAAVQTIVARVVDPLDSAVVSITTIHGGEAFNVIPDRVEMKGTVRTFSEAVSRTIEAELKRICEKTAEAFGAKASVERPPKIPYPPTVNHPAETELALAAMCAVAGPEGVSDDLRPVMGSEDFAFILRKVPGAYIFVGNGDTAGLHNPRYDFNDAALPHGVAYWTELARRVLPA